MNFFDFLTGPNGPLSPEQRRELQLNQLRNRQQMERQAKEALPILKEMRAKAHELVKLGVDVSDVRQRLAIVYDNMQAYLEEPPPPDQGG